MAQDEQRKPPPEYKLGTSDLIRWLRSQTNKPVPAFIRFIAARDFGRPELSIRQFRAMFEAMSPENTAMVSVENFHPTHVDVSAHVQVMIEEMPNGTFSVIWPNGLCTQETTLSARYIPLGDLRRSQHH